jgi:PPOX class probable F420-dependent enzyme
VAIADEKYIALTTYRKNGDSSSTAVWIVDLDDGTIGFTTPSGSLKVERIRNDNRVLLQPSDSRGRPNAHSSQVSGTAEVVDGADFERIKAEVKDKYGWNVTAVSLFQKAAKLFGKAYVSNAAIVITLD